MTLIGRVGDDAMAEVALSGLDGVHLHVTRDPERSTGTCVVLVAPGGERTMLPDPGANDALAATDLPRFDGGILHVSGYALLRPGSRAAALEAIERARDAGMKISVDPASAAPLANDPIFLARVAPIDLLLPNADEADVLGPQISVPGARDQARRDGRDVVGRDRDDRRARGGRRRCGRHHGRGRRVRRRVPQRLAGIAGAGAGGGRAAGRPGDRPSRRTPGMTRILFVCMGNICRSPTAEGVMRSLVREAGLEDEIEIDSAGTGGWHVGDPPDRRATAAAAARGITLAGAARQVRAARLRATTTCCWRWTARTCAGCGRRAGRRGRGEGAAAARVRSRARRRARPRRARPVLRRRGRLRDRARPGRGRLPRPAR